jgi:uncharacterized PurR-regulated membrane protein YhhQ (DUF165 family)
MKPVEKFQQLSRPQKFWLIAISSPLLIATGLLFLGLSNVIAAIFALPIIGWAISRNSWRAGKRSSDKKVYLSFLLSLVATVIVLLVLRQPQFRTDWEGGNPLDDVIMLLWLATVVALATTWYLAGWVGHRLLMTRRASKAPGQKQNRVAAPEK